MSEANSPQLPIMARRDRHTRIAIVLRESGAPLRLVKGILDAIEAHDGPVLHRRFLQAAGIRLISGEDASNAELYGLRHRLPGSL